MFIHHYFRAARKVVGGAFRQGSFSSEFEKAFFRGEAESGACRRSGSSSEGEFRARLQRRMNETIDLSLCGETAHEYRALTGETGRDGNQDEKRWARLRDCTGGWRSGGGSGGGGGRGSGESIKRFAGRPEGRRDAERRDRG